MDVSLVVGKIENNLYNNKTRYTLQCSGQRKEL